MDAMKRSNVIDSLTENKLFMASVVDGPTVILAKDIVHGLYLARAITAARNLHQC